MKEKRSFFERLTGAINVDHEDDFDEMEEEELPVSRGASMQQREQKDWMEEESEEGQLMVDVYQTNDHIVVQSMVAGVMPEDLNVSITREMVTISGKRDLPRGVREEDHFYKELYWGPFSRTILLPQEIEPDGAEALEKNGLLTIKLPKIDKDKRQQIKVRVG